MDQYASSIRTRPRRRRKNSPPRIQNFQKSSKVVDVNIELDDVDVRVLNPVLLLQLEVQIVLFAEVFGLFDKTVLRNTKKVTLDLDTSV